MKSILFTGISLLVSFYSFSQPDGPEQLPDIRLDTITLNHPEKRVIAKTDISNIIVIDGRFDSSCLGYYQTNSGKNYSIITEGNLARKISTFLENYLQVDNGKSIIIVLKKLWLTNECIEEKVESANKKTANGSWLKGIIAKFEFYCSYEDGYTPLYRFDSIFSGLSNINEYSREYLYDALITSVQKLVTANLNNLSSARKKMSIHDIIAYTRQQFNIPITNTTTYMKGVYKTFTEFKNNTPSYINYEIRKDKLTETIFVKDKLGEHPVRDVWGFSDGNNIYVQASDNYFPLTKKQNTFVCYGAKELSRSRHVRAENVLILGVFAGGLGNGNKKVSYKVKRKLYQLDMETGELY
jgi:hypothetical protein